MLEERIASIEKALVVMQESNLKYFSANSDHLKAASEAYLRMQKDVQELKALIQVLREEVLELSKKSR
ncbi:MAG: hypothetical protein WAW61_16925 [Methylococcaceae bacterium]